MCVRQTNVESRIPGPRQTVEGPSSDDVLVFLLLLLGNINIYIIYERHSRGGATVFPEFEQTSVLTRIIGPSRHPTGTESTIDVLTLLCSSVSKLDIEST